MENQSILLSKRSIWWMSAFLAGMLLIGSFFDYPISCALYDGKNTFGLYLAAYGEYPATLGFVAAGILLWIGHSKDSKGKAILQCLGGTMLIVFGTLMAMNMPALYLLVSPIILKVIGLVCSVSVILCLVRLCRNADRKIIVRVAVVLFFAIFTEMLLVNLIKIPWGRARMRLVATDPNAYFMPWWQAGSELKKSLVAAGAAAEEFKSFPSGHVANASILMLLGLLPMLNQKLSSKRAFLVGIGFGFTCLVALSRIIMGAHYLTDTTVGFALSLAVMLLVYQIVFYKYIKDTQLQGVK